VIVTDLKFFKTLKTKRWTAKVQNKEIIINSIAKVIKGTIYEDELHNLYSPPHCIRAIK
jgi:hypothetical protein